MTTYPTEPVAINYRDSEYRLWQNDADWWVANVAVGGEFHGASRECVERHAREQMDWLLATQEEGGLQQ